MDSLSSINNSIIQNESQNNFNSVLAANTSTKASNVALSVLFGAGALVLFTISAIAFSASAIPVGVGCVIAGVSLLVTAIYFATKKSSSLRYQLNTTPNFHMKEDPQLLNNFKEGLAKEKKRLQKLRNELYSLSELGNDEKKAEIKKQISDCLSRKTYFRIEIERYERLFGSDS